VIGSYEHNREILGSVNSRKFLDWMSNCYIVKDSTPWSIKY
jgi:hypothetical protein